MLKSTMEGLGYTTHGGTDAPYVFVDLEGKSSWDTFSELLESSQVVTIPGAGFGPGGEGFRGDLDELTFYDRALTAAEVAALALDLPGGVAAAPAIEGTTADRPTRRTNSPRKCGEL